MANYISLNVKNFCNLSNFYGWISANFNVKDCCVDHIIATINISKSRTSKEGKLYRNVSCIGNFHIANLDCMYKHTPRLFKGSIFFIIIFIFYDHECLD